MTSHRVVIDARFLHHTGVGRVTRTMLEGLSQLDLAGEFGVWGDDEAVRLAGPQFTHIQYDGNPLALGAQRDSFSVPAGRMIHLHGFFPLMAPKALATFVLDTIPLRHEPSRTRRAMFHALLHAAVRRSDHVLTISRASADRIETDLGRRATVIRPAVDLALAKAVHEQRHDVGSTLLYVGQGKRYKNVEGAIAGFRRSSFAASGARLEIVGPDDHDAARLRLFAAHDANVSVLGRVDEVALKTAYGRARAVIQPSFEEGFGLTVIEALAAGIPVCCSDRPALREAAAGRAALFDPEDPASIASGIDAAVTGPLPDPSIRETTSVEFARSVLVAVGLSDRVAAPKIVSLS